MNPRTVLIVLQVAGAITLLVYPGVLVAGVMALAAGGSVAWLALMVASLAYPLLWFALWGLSWWALRRGRVGLALAASTPPALVLVAVLAIGVIGQFYTSALLSGASAAAAKEVEHARQQNPLAGAVLSFDAGSGSWSELEAAIEAASPESLSQPIERLPIEATLGPLVKVERPPGAPPEPVRHASPLGLALVASRLGDTMATANAKPRLLQAARRMTERGARLCADELAQPRLVWLAEIVARGATLPDPAALRENPLVWTLVTIAPTREHEVAQGIFDAGHDNPGLLDRPTRTYGTPLRAALVRGLASRVDDLLYNGAELSAAEREVPGLAAALEAILARPQNAHLREARATRLRRKAAK